MGRRHNAARLCLVVAGVLMAASARAATTGRAISLKMLQASVRAGNSQAASKLFGVTRLNGFVTDRASRDIILIGTVDPGLPRLHLDDFVVALRAAKLVYGRRDGRTIYYSAPGCSIDPDPQVLRRLQQVRTGADDRSAVDKWKSIGSEPQSVRVMGVPFDSRFAKVMVDADYDMKRLVNGSVDLGIEGFESLMGMRVAIAEAGLRGNAPDYGSPMAMNRFWFCPGECTYGESGGAVTIAECRVELLTEEQFVAASGKATGTGKPGDLAQRFAGGFTSHYADIAARRPIYAELEGLFRMAALTKLIEDGDAEPASGASLDYLAARHRVRAVPVARKLAGLTRVQKLSHRTDTDDGYETRSVALLSCGGVSMDVRPKRVANRGRASVTKGGALRRPGATGDSTSLRSRVLDARKEKGAVYWDFPAPPS